MNIKRPKQLYSKEKIEEFRNMSIQSRLAWLEEANILANRILGFEKRALQDERFIGLTEYRHE